jgi:hypothetical protein
MAERDDEPTGFLSRWSRRKRGVEEAKPAPIAPPTPHPDPVPASGENAEVAAVVQEPLPTLDDVAKLTPESDFSRFVAPQVDPGVRNAAMKKLFADPHYNVMDGLDTYIDDYNKFEPIPKSMLRQLVSARALGLIDDELEEQPTPPDNPVPHEDAAVQLQPDDAAGPEGAGGSVAERPADDDPHDPVPPRGA